MRYALRAGTFTAQSKLDPREAHSAARSGLSVVTPQTLTRPRLRYIDHEGRVWQEDSRSAEQLIEDWKRAQRKKGHRP